MRKILKKWEFGGSAEISADEILDAMKEGDGHSDIRMEINASGGADFGYDVEIEITRPETKEEWADRKALERRNSAENEAKRKAEIREERRRLYDTLKLEFGDT